MSDNDLNQALNSAQAGIRQFGEEIVSLRARLAETEARCRELESDLLQVRDSTGRVPVHRVTYEDGPELTWKDALEASEARAAMLREALIQAHLVVTDAALEADDPNYDLAVVDIGKALAASAGAAAEYRARLRAEAWREAAAIAQFYSPGETQSDEANAAPSLRTAWTWGAVHAACKLSESFAALAAGEPRDEGGGAE